MESGLMGQGIAIESEGSLLSTLPGVGSRPCQNAPGDPQVKKTFKTERLTLSEWTCPLNNCPEMADGLPKKHISILAFVRVSSGNFLRMFVLPSWQNPTVKKEHQLLVPVSFSPLSESCLKIKKGKGYI